MDLQTDKSRISIKSWNEPLDIQRCNKTPGSPFQRDWKEDRGVTQHGFCNFGENRLWSALYANYWAGAGRGNDL
jgi:hypothetical protein